MEILRTADDPTPARGVHEVRIAVEDLVENPFLDNPIQVEFQRPDDSSVSVETFFDGEDMFVARAYCDQLGEWRWDARRGQGTSLGTGSFEVIPSDLPGKLRHHREDSRRLRYDRGDWFLHIGDTGYRYPIDTEPEWRAYLDEAVRMGATKIRTWFAKSRHGIEWVFADESRGSNRLDVSAWQEIDRRYRYALETYPHVQFQVIPYAEDGEAVRDYPEAPMVRYVGEYAQARFSAFPNVYWCVANDVKLLDGDPDPEIVEQGARVQSGVSRPVIDAIGADFKRREPWGTLITSHQLRTTGYDFRDASWSDLVTLHDLDQGAGERVREYYHAADCPVILDEDRYEHYREPEHPAYFFRRLFWVNLLAGGHPTYGGNRTYEAYDGSDQGVRPYGESDLVGLDDVRGIHQFFEETGLDLAGLAPDTGIIGADPQRAVCAHDNQTYLCYMSNPDNGDPQQATAREEPQSVTISLPSGEFVSRWFNPRTHRWSSSSKMSGGSQTVTTPGDADWVLLLERVNSSPT